MKNLLLLLVSVLMLTASCGDDDGTSLPEKKDLTLAVKYLAESADDEQYEGWIIVDGKPVSTGTFTADKAGDLSSATFEVEAAMLDKATKFVVTLEPKPDTDPTPSLFKILGGDFSDESAPLSVSHAVAFGVDFSDIAGSVALATPTTTSTDDELGGIWFVTFTDGAPAGPGLTTLPTLPSQWKYEGWVVIDGTPVSTGTFSTAAGADDAAPFSGPDAPTVGGIPIPGGKVPFPGEDFITSAPTGLTFPLVLSGKTVVVSIEPVPDNSPLPFAFKPLVAMLPDPAATRTNYPLVYNANTFPSGTVSR